MTSSFDFIIIHLRIDHNYYKFFEISIFHAQLPTSLLCNVFWVISSSVLLFTLFAGTDGLVIPLAYADKRSPGICKSKECIAMNEYLKSKVDLTVDPCQDFYQFACGKHKDGKSEVKRANLKVTNQLIEIVKQPPAVKDHKALKMAKQMFQQCLKHESNAEQLKNMISHLGGWYLFDSNRTETNFSLGNFFSKSMEIGYLSNALFTIDVAIDPVTKLNIIAIKPKGPLNCLIDKMFSTTGFFKSSANKGESHIYVFQKFIPKFASKMKTDQIKVKNVYDEYKKIGKRLHEINQEPKYVQWMRLQDVMATYDNIPWVQILTPVFKPILLHPTDVIQIDCPRCLKSLNVFFRNTSMNSLASYLIGYFAFYAILYADDEMLNDWLVDANTKEYFCANTIFSLFRRVMDYEYINSKYFDKSSTLFVSNFIRQFKSTMVNIIRVSPMMNSDNKTKDEAIAKVQEMVFKVAYDDELIKGQQSLQYYDKLNLNPKSYLISLFNAKKFIKKKLLISIGNIAKPRYFEATDGNAAYHNYYNTFFLSIPVLTNVYYSKANRPEYLNFGGLGNIIAHEMQHAFDPKSSSFDKVGKIRNWWNPDAKKEYYQRLECIKTQYSDFINVETGNKVNGLRTLYENFCDIGGMEVIYQAYRDFPKGGELLLQDFSNLTLHQMFWISYASNLCAKPSKEDVLKRETNDKHPIERIRVNGVAMNNKEFAKDWNCKTNAPMNPNMKCPVWK